MKFCGDYRDIFSKKYYLVQKLDHLTCSKLEITTSLYKTIKLVKLMFVFSPELHYMPDGLTFKLLFSDENVTVVAKWPENRPC